MAELDADGLVIHIIKNRKEVHLIEALVRTPKADNQELAEQLACR